MCIKKVLYSVIGIFLAVGILWKGLNFMAQRVSKKEMAEVIVRLHAAMEMMATSMQDMQQRLQKIENTPAQGSAVSDKFVFGKGTADGSSKHNS